MQVAVVLSFVVFAAAAIAAAAALIAYQRKQQRAFLAEINRLRSLIEANDPEQEDQDEQVEEESL